MSGYDQTGARRVTEHDDAPAWGFADIAVCQRCSKDVVLDHDPPCPHGYAACPECGHEAVCLDCRLTAEREMHETGAYSEAADPFFDQHAKPRDSNVMTNAEVWEEYRRETRARKTEGGAGA